jgi:hypothetical protein
MGSIWIKKPGKWISCKMASMAQFMVGAVGGAAANRYATRKGLTVKTKQLTRV